MPFASKPDVLFRVDAGAVVGLSFGHLYRCLALAGELSSRHALRSAFVMRAYESGVRVARDAGYDVRTVAVEAGEAAAAALAAGRDCKLVALDLPGLGDDAVRDYRRAAPRLCVIDDGDGDFPMADLVVQGHVHARESSDPRRLRGARYAVLGPQFDGPHTRRRGSRVLVTFGGSDPSGLTPLAAKTLAAAPLGAGVDLVLGPGFNDLAAIPAAPGFRIHTAVPDLASLMTTCAVAVSAAGRTAYELAALGTPAILIPSNDHEAATAEVFAREGAAVLLPRADVPARLSGILRDLLGDPVRRRHMIDSARRLVDSGGRRRVADALLQRIAEPAVRARRSKPSEQVPS